MSETLPIDFEFDAKSAANYACWHEMTLRFQDLDPLGHVTSLSFLTLFETARILYVREAGLPFAMPKETWMLVNLNADYHAQMHFPGTIRTGTRLKRLGRTSITTIQGLFNGDTCAANLTSVLVHVDRSTDKAAIIPDELRGALETLSTTGALSS